MELSPEAVLDLLQAVKDPEIPAVSIVELGLVGSVSIEDGALRVEILPTYSGCPALKTIEDEVEDVLRQHGFAAVRVVRSYSPAWSSERISAAGREKLRRYGIAPPIPVEQPELVPLPGKNPVICCPFCESAETECRSEFGSTACKSLYYCRGCEQPFEYFKSL